MRRPSGLRLCPIFSFWLSMPKQSGPKHIFPRVRSRSTGHNYRPDDAKCWKSRKEAKLLDAAQIVLRRWNGPRTFAYKNPKICLLSHIFLMLKLTIRSDGLNIKEELLACRLVSIPVMLDNDLKAKKIRESTFISSPPCYSKGFKYHIHYTAI